MNKQIIGIILGIFLISLVSTLTINSGECEVINLNTTKPLYWTVSGNSSNMEGINITYEVFGDYINATVCLHPMFKEDSFTLIFIEEQTKEIIIEVPSGGGGGSSTKYVDKIIEVPNYIPKEIIKEIEKEVPSDPEIIEKPPTWIWFALTFLGLIILFLIFKGKRK